jgi:hypothetical protein
MGFKKWLKKCDMIFFPNDPVKIPATQQQQSMWICNRKEILIDYVMKFEELENDWKSVCEVIGIRHKPLTSTHKTNHKNYREYYDDESIEIVGKNFKTDIKLFDYEY